MSDDALHIFIWWIIRNVKLIEITAHDDGDAYTIFETMNDRGLSLSPTEMLKGYPLANIESPDGRLEADTLIRKCLGRFAEHIKETEADFFKAWFRSQYAQDIRQGNRDAQPGDFDRIGTEYHRRVRNDEQAPGLQTSDDFHRFEPRDMRISADLYLKLLDASAARTKGPDSIKYNADAGFTLQHHVILSAISVEDDAGTTSTKPVYLDRFTYKAIYRQLERFADWLEQRSGGPVHYEGYMDRSGQYAFETEHIRTYHHHRFKDEFDQRDDFVEHSNLIGGLLPLPKRSMPASATRAMPRSYRIT